MWLLYLQIVPFCGIQGVFLEYTNQMPACMQQIKKNKKIKLFIYLNLDHNKFGQIVHYFIIAWPYLVECHNLQPKTEIEEPNQKQTKAHCNKCLMGKTVFNIFSEITFD